MSEKEKTQTAFLRPKRWFRKADYQRTKKVKVFGLTTSSGKVLAVPCPTPMTGEKFADLVRRKIKPFLKTDSIDDSNNLKCYEILTKVIAIFEDDWKIFTTGVCVFEDYP